MVVGEGLAGGEIRSRARRVKGRCLDVGFERAQLRRETVFLGWVEAQHDACAGGDGFRVEGSGAGDDEGLWLRGLRDEGPRFALEEALFDLALEAGAVVFVSVRVERGLFFEDGLDADLADFLAEQRDALLALVPGKDARSYAVGDFGHFRGHVVEQDGAEAGELGVA